MGDGLRPYAVVQETALAISRLRELPWQLLYVTLSPYLAQGPLALYGAHGFENAAQEADFLSFRELLETMRVPLGREVDLKAFRGWYDRHRQAVRALGNVDAHALFEEFRGVIGAQPGLQDTWHWVRARACCRPPRANAAPRISVQHAVIVLRDEDKAAARESLRTPLLFSVHEAKGLEYPHVVLFSLVSGQRAAYAEGCEGVTAADVQCEDLDYARARDKTDRSLEGYRFYVNALYVAMTRAVRSLTLVESDSSHALLDLLGLQAGEARLQAACVPTKDEWAQEARSWSCRARWSRPRPSARPSCSTARCPERRGTSRISSSLRSRRSMPPTAAPKPGRR